MSRRDKLPPLNALRAFEAAAHTMSFTAAASELGVTPSAISHQVRFLEEYLDVKLFTRHHKVIKLTAEGTAYLKALNAAFDTIGAATQKLVQVHRKDVLDIGLSLATLGIRWLIPRLWKFQSLHPQIEVRMTTSLKDASFAREDMDVYLTRGPIEAAESHVGLIFKERLAVVCSPRFLESGRPMDLSQMTDLPRIVVESRTDIWPTVFAAAGLSDGPSVPHIHFDYHYMGVQAVVGGLGIAAVPVCLIEDELNEGTLVRLFDQDIPTDQAYYIDYPEAHERLEKIRAFHEWLVQEASAAGEGTGQKLAAR